MRDLSPWFQSTLSGCDLILWHVKRFLDRYIMNRCVKIKWFIRIWVWSHLEFSSWNKHEFHAKRICIVFGTSVDLGLSSTQPEITRIDTRITKTVITINSFRFGDEIIAWTPFVMLLLCKSFTIPLYCFGMFPSSRARSLKKGMLRLSGKQKEIR